MSESILVQRGRLLMQQRRFAEAAEQFMMQLSSEPDDAMAHALLALCWRTNESRLPDATREAEHALRLAPEQPYAHYVMGLVLTERRLHQQAMQFVDAAIQLNPVETDYYALRARVLVAMERWSDAERAAQMGLQFDPQDDSCLGLLAFALERQGKKSHALDRAKEAVANDPESGYALAMLGWAQLQSGEHREAKKSFREALRIEPNFAFARSGMLEAIKSGNPIYRGLFAFQSAVGRMQARYRWAIPIGFYVCYLLLIRVLSMHPVLEAFRTPIIVLYVGLCLFTWLTDPIFDFLLRFDSFGRHLLSGEDRRISIVTVTMVAIAAIASIYAFVFATPSDALDLVLACVAVAIMLTVYLRIESGWLKIAALVCAIFVCILSFLTATLFLMGTDLHALTALAAILLASVFAIASNLINTLRPR